MGADNLAQFHRWQDWRWIIENVPVGVIARPGDRIAARLSMAAQVYGQSKVTSRASHIIGRLPAPAWSFVNVPMSDHSSTAIRARGEW
jgi:nicotinate-nucleotide adenylyltransferase